MKQFDLVAYCQLAEKSYYESIVGDKALFLGWGSDVLDLGSRSTERDIDVLRVGRQPDDWDDDKQTQILCAQHGLNFHGRPPFGATPETQHQALMSYYGRSKFVVAHSNLAAPAGYTHPTKEYITGRWTDAVAAGAIIAGAQPFLDPAIDVLLWPEAMVHFPEIDVHKNITQLVEAFDAWTPATAALNYRRALERLDWRWRISLLAERLEIKTDTLEREMSRLKTQISKT